MKSRGFTLLELIVVIAVIAILAAAVTPAVFQQILDRRVAATQDEARTLADAIAGDYTQSRYGFVGDIGRLPTSLNELMQSNGLPSYNTSHTRGIGMGWRGPYVNEGTSTNDYLTDSFGRNYSLNSGQIRSAGPDGVFNNADDIVYPPSAPAILGSVQVTVKTITGNKTVVDPSGYGVTLFYASGGTEQSVSNTTSPFVFNNVPMGIHAVRVVKLNNPNAGTVMVTDTVVVRPGNTAAVELWF